MRPSALWLLAVLAGGACTDLPSAPDDPGMRVVAGPSATDTIDAYPQQLLVVEVRDENGIPIRDVEVTFASAVTAEFPATVSSIYALRTTDGNGRATTRLRFGTVAGAARLVIAVPSLALQTDVSYQVQAGRPVQLQAPAQALTLGDTIVPTVRALDRYGNLSALPVALSEARPPLALTADQRLYGTAYGTGHVRVQVLGFVDSAAVTVVPEGWLAGYAVAGLDTLPAGIHRLTLDGRRGGLVAAQTLGMPEPYGIDWSPDGSFLAYGDVPGNRVMLVNTVSGAAAPLAGTAAFTRAHSPQFSPDGSGIRFWGRSPDGAGLWQAPLAGGAPVLLVPDASADAHLSSDGTRVTYALAGSIVIQDVASGEVTDPGVAGSGPRFSPDGRHLAFLDAAGRVALLHLGTGSVRSVALPGTIFTLDWSPLGAWLLAGGSDGTYLVSFATLLVLPLHHHLRWPAFRFVQESAPPTD